MVQLSTTYTDPERSRQTPHHKISKAVRSALSATYVILVMVAINSCSNVDKRLSNDCKVV